MGALMRRGIVAIVFRRGREMTIGFGYGRLMKSAGGRIISSWG
jgi:hypothetical protein